LNELILRTLNVDFKLVEFDTIKAMV